MIKDLNSQVLRSEQNEKPDALFDNRIWVGTKKAAEYLERSAGQIRNMVWRGQIKAKKFHGKLYFNTNDLKALLDNAPYV